MTFAAERQQQTRGPGLCHLQTSEPQCLPARLRSRTAAKGNDPRTNLYPTHRRRDRDSKTISVLSFGRNEQQKLSFRLAEPTQIISLPHHSYLFPRSNIFFRDLNYTLHLASLALAQAVFSTMLSPCTGMYFSFLIMHRFIFYFVLCSLHLVLSTSKAMITSYPVPLYRSQHLPQWWQRGQCRGSICKLRNRVPKFCLINSYNIVIFHDQIQNVQTEEMVA